MGVVLSIIAGFFNLLGWIRGNKDKQIGRDEQKVTDLEGSLKLQQREDEASSNAPHTVEDLQEKLSEGKF